MRTGFTLMELLVVISIMCLLLSLLFSAVKLVRDRSAMVNCLSQERQLALFSMGYAEDNAGALATSNTVDSHAYNTWLWTDTSGYSKLDAAGNLQGVLIPFFEAATPQRWVVCPAASSANKQAVKASYGFCDRMNPAGTYSGASLGAKCFRNQAEIPKSSVQLLIMEEDQVYDGFNTVGLNAWGDRAGSFHRTGSNVVYADGHGAWYQWRDPVGTLGAYRWYVPSNPADCNFYHLGNVPP